MRRPCFDSARAYVTCVTETALYQENGVRHWDAIEAIRVCRPVPTSRASPKRRSTSRAACLTQAGGSRGRRERAARAGGASGRCKRAALAVQAGGASGQRERMARSDGVQMGRYWEVETDHEGPAPVKAGCGVSGRRERGREWVARTGGASGRLKRAARAGGAIGWREVMVCRWDGIGTQLGRFRPQAPWGGWVIGRWPKGRVVCLGRRFVCRG
jgi:hypothetical protein